VTRHLLFSEIFQSSACGDLFFGENRPSLRVPLFFFLDGLSVKVCFCFGLPSIACCAVGANLRIFDLLFFFPRKFAISAICLNCPQTPPQYNSLSLSPFLPPNNFLMTLMLLPPLAPSPFLLPSSTHNSIYLLLPPFSYRAVGRFGSPPEKDDPPSHLRSNFPLVSSWGRPRALLVPPPRCVLSVFIPVVMPPLFLFPSCRVDFPCLLPPNLRLLSPILPLLSTFLFFAFTPYGECVLH